jgi:hypothetical protein
VGIGPEHRHLAGHGPDSLGNTLPAANVVFVGTTRGVVSDDRGRYEISIPADSTVSIRWSYTGLISQEKEYGLPLEKNVR